MKLREALQTQEMLQSKAAELEARLLALRLELKEAYAELESTRARDTTEVELVERFVLARRAELLARPVGRDGKRLTPEQLEAVLQAEVTVAVQRYRNRRRPAATGRRGVH